MNNKKRAGKLPAIISLSVIGLLFVLITVLTVIDFPYDYHPKNEAQIHIYGETHGSRAFCEKEFEAWKQYYDDGHRALFVELPYYTAEYLNLWIQSDNDDILNQLYEDIEGTLAATPAFLEFYRNIKTECPETVLYGTDVGHQYDVTGARYLEYLSSNGLENTKEYALAAECVQQGMEFYGKEATDPYRENKMVENFVAAYERCGETEIMGIYGSYHCDPTYSDLMAGQLKEKYGDVVEGIYVINLVANNRKPFHFGFGYIGLLFLLMLFIPNIIWAKHQPAGYSEYAKNENKVLGIIEKIGQVTVTCLALVFTDSNFDFTITDITVYIPNRNLYLLLAFVMMVIYEVFWARYFGSKKEMTDFYRSCCGVPLAGATLPVMAFFLLGCAGKNIALMAAAVVLGVGHIGIHMQYAKAVNQKEQ